MEVLPADNLTEPRSDVEFSVPPRSDLFFRTLVDNLPAGAYICDAEGLITYYNEEALRVWGRAPALNDPAERFCGSFRLCESDGTTVDHSRCWMALALHEEKPYKGEEIVIERPDGEKKTVLVNANPIHDEAGRLLGAVNVVVDITDRKRAEVELQEKNELLALLNRASTTMASELQLSRLVQVITDVGVELTKAEFGAFFYNSIDADGEKYTLYTLSGAPRSAFENYPMPRNTHIFGPTFRGEAIVRSDDITRDERYGKNPPYYGMPEGHLPVRSYLAVPVVSRSGEVVVGGLFFGHPEPGVFDQQAEDLISGIAGQAGVAIDNARLYEAAVGASRTLEEKVAQRTAELEDLNEELESFNYSVSHDLRAPLRAISGFSQALLSDYSEVLDDEARHYLSRIDHGSARMTHLIDSLLHLSRLMRVDVNRELLRLDELVDEVVAEIREQEPDRRVEVEVAAGVEVRGDRELLRVALANLLGNAWKFTRDRDPAHVEVGVEKQGDETVYFVKDDGVGFDMAYAEKLFQAFQRLHAVEEFNGTGIGLATVRRIVKRHGGAVWAHGEPGNGATFYFTLGSS